MSEGQFFSTACTSAGNILAYGWKCAFESPFIKHFHLEKIKIKNLFFFSLALEILFLHRLAFSVLNTISFYCHSHEYWQYFWGYLAMGKTTVFQKLGKLEVGGFK